MVWKKASRSKYGNIRQEYNGSTYDSKGEARYAGELDLLLRAKEIKGYQRQVRFPIVVEGFYICSYIADFVVETNTGEKEIHEFKGVLSSTFKLKWKLVEALYGKEYKLLLIL